MADACTRHGSTKASHNPLQRQIPDPERAQMICCAFNIICARSRAPDTRTHQIKRRCITEATRILPMRGIGNIREGSHRRTACARQSTSHPGRPIHGGDHFTRMHPFIDGLRVNSPDPIGDSFGDAAPIQPEHQPRICLSSPIHPGIHAKGAMIAIEHGLAAFLIAKKTAATSMSRRRTAKNCLWETETRARRQQGPTNRAYAGSASRHQSDPQHRRRHTDQRQRGEGFAKQKICLDRNYRGHEIK